MVEITVPDSVFGRQLNNLIGKMGEAAIIQYFEEKSFRILGGFGTFPPEHAFNVTLKDGTPFPAPFDFLLLKNGKHCIVDIKSTIKDEWKKKEIF